MKLTGKIGGCEVTLNRPEPVEHRGTWYEFVSFRPVAWGEKYKHLSKNEIVEGDKLMPPRIFETCYGPRWIAIEIPRATPEQLKAIGMRCRDDRPVECKVGDVVWDKINSNTSEGKWTIGSLRDPSFDKPRWVLVDAPVEKEPFMHFVCPDCGKHVKADEDGCCVHCGADCTGEVCHCKPPAPQDKGEVHTSCADGVCPVCKKANCHFDREECPGA